MRRWNQCSICGKFVSMADFTSGAARRELVTPDSEFTSEEFETYHVNCHNEEVMIEMMEGR